MCSRLQVCSPVFSVGSVKSLRFQGLILPQSTTSSPNGCHFTLASREVGIALPPASNHRFGDTTTPPWPSHIGAMVMITLSINAWDDGSSRALITPLPPSIITLLRPSFFKVSSTAVQSKSWPVCSGVVISSVTNFPPCSSRICFCLVGGDGFCVKIKGARPQAHSHP